MAIDITVVSNFCSGKNHTTLPYGCIFSNFFRLHISAWMYHFFNGVLYFSIPKTDRNLLYNLKHHIYAMLKPDKLHRRRIQTIRATARELPVTHNLAGSVLQFFYLFHRPEVHQNSRLLQQLTGKVPCVHVLPGFHLRERHTDNKPV